MNNTTICKWAVCYDIDGRTQDDKQTKREVVAVFRFPHYAEDFIVKCLPNAEKDRFYIINIGGGQ